MQFLVTPIITFICLMGMFFSQAQARIYIDITQASADPFPIAITPPYLEAGTPNAQIATRFKQKLESNLKLIGIFRLIPESAFLENQSKKLFLPTQIDFANWAVIDAMGLIKSKYKVVGTQIEIEIKLYDVLLKRPILEKKYLTQPDALEKVANRFANEVVKALTGEEGFFESRITFICKPKAHKELCVMDFDGGNVEQLTHYNSITLSPAWTPTGDEIFFTSFFGSKQPRVFKHNLASGKNSGVSQSSGMMIGMDVDPEGQFLMTTLTKDKNSELYLLSKEGRIHKRLTFNRALDVSGRFSHDGKQIAFVTNRAGSVQVFLMDRNGRFPKQMTFKGLNNTSPAFSRDGKTIFFAGMDRDGHFDIFSLDIASKNIKRLTFDSKDNVEPSVSPGGHMVVFSSNRTGTYQLWAMRPDGSGQIQLSKKPWAHHMPAWGPNP